MSKRATYNVTESRKIKLERLAINASVKLERTVTWTELLTYIIDNHSKELFEDFIASEIEKKKQNDEIEKATKMYNLPRPK